jgi:hypothetical protein
MLLVRPSPPTFCSFVPENFACQLRPVDSACQLFYLLYTKDFADYYCDERALLTYGLARAWDATDMRLPVLRRRHLIQASAWRPRKG